MVLVSKLMNKKILKKIFVCTRGNDIVNVMDYVKFRTQNCEHQFSLKINFPI